ncbi:MAG: hypothetical protein RSG48_00705 [Clostridia bacterium]
MRYMKFKNNKFKLNVVAIFLLVIGFITTLNISYCAPNGMPDTITITSSGPTAKWFYYENGDKEVVKEVYETTFPHNNQTLNAYCLDEGKILWLGAHVLKYESPLAGNLIAAFPQINGPTGWNNYGFTDVEGWAYHAAGQHYASQFALWDIQQGGRLYREAKDKKHYG